MTVTVDQNISKLFAILKAESKTAIEQALYRDVFAVACHLHSGGHEEAGVKLLGTLFNHLGRNLRTTLISDFFSSLSGNEYTYGIGIAPHREIGRLFDNFPCTVSTEDTRDVL